MEGFQMKSAGHAGLVAVLVIACVALVPTLAQADSGDNVVVTRPGVVFHKAGSDDVRGRGFEKTIDAALEAGYTPCQICFGKELAGVGIATASAGAVVGGFGQAQMGIPAPPGSTVTQPFGLRVVSTNQGTGLRGGTRNPYLPADTIRRAVDQGAYETR